MSSPTSRPTDEQVRALARFAQWALQNGPWDGCDIDGADAQQKAEDLGVVVRRIMDKPCGEFCSCAEYGSFPAACYRLPDWLLEAAGQTTLQAEE